MPRGERPLDKGDSPLLRFAADLRKVREHAGMPPYRELSRRAHYSSAALADAASGRKLPSLEVTLSYVRACEADVEAWEQRWREVAAELLAGEAVPEDDTDAPYAGLRAFQPEDGDRFFGRERLVDELLSTLSQQRFVCLFGTSGSGKSSLLRAGLLPRLDTTVLFTPGDHPVEECAIHLARLTGTSPVRLTEELNAAPRNLHRVVHGGPRLVLVVDQFEEIFTLCRDPAERQKFLDMLTAAAHAETGGCRVVIAVRADFFAHCTRHPELVDALRTGQVTIGPMTTSELRRAILRPAVDAGYTLESELQATIIADASGQAGVLPLVSHALLETWRRRRGNTLTLSAFEAAGGLTGALARTADSLYEACTPEQQDHVRSLFVRLTALGEETGDTKRSLDRHELDDDPDLRDVLERFARMRLITLDRTTVQISHEALIRSWPRLRDWLTADREGLRLHRRLTEATGIWESLDHDPEALYRGARLTTALEWAERHDSALTTRERQFVQAGRAAHIRRSRRLRQVVALLSVLLMIATATAGYAVYAGRTAAAQRNVALSQIAAGKAETLRKTNPALAAQLSLAAFRLSPTADARTAVLNSYPLPRGGRLNGHTDHVNSVEFDGDGRTVVTTSHDGTARLWDVGDPARITERTQLAGHRASVIHGVFSRDSATLATASWDHTARLWDVPSGRTRTVLAGHTREVNAAALSNDGTLLATASTDQTAKLWNTATAQEIATFTGHTDAVISVAFTPDARTLATAGWDRRAALWDVADPGSPRFLNGHTGPVVWLAFSPDGKVLATASHDKTVRLWDTSDPHHPHELSILTGHLGLVRAVAFHPRMALLATAGTDQTARLWDISDPRHPKTIATFSGHTNTIVSVAFSPDGHTLATASDDNTALVWSLPPLPADDVDRIGAWICSVARPAMTETQWQLYFPGVRPHLPC